MGLVQIQWFDPVALDITWEDKDELIQRFPVAAAWWQATSQGGGDVRVPNDMGITQQRERPKRLAAQQALPWARMDTLRTRARPT
jgi:hypothetical protein